MAPEPNEAVSTRRAMLARHILRLLGLYQLSLGGWFMVLRPPLLPEDLHYISQASSGLRTWLDLVFNVMGGQMAALGCALLIVSRCSLDGLKRADRTFLLACGALSALLMAYTNFVLGSNFRWALLIPVALWIAFGATVLADRSVLPTSDIGPK
ncbi:hypothetical protein [Novosphingobium lentum]|uniref:hypothetical protein n=1 Tax=Novosphingobium lentum TaxID=145287 RepID=UPI00083590F9|nr:hypothetical protein [Novosphingobium lentum]